MNILGISGYYHDSSATLLMDGDIVAAVQEERFTRRKYDPSFPKHSITYCLKEGNIKPKELDYVVFYDKPFLKFERIFETYLAFAPKGFNSFRKSGQNPRISAENPHVSPYPKGLWPSSRYV